MTSEEFQVLVLKQLQALAEGQLRLETRMDSLDTNMNSLDTRMDSLDKGQLCLETRIENEVIDKIRGLYDFREVTNDQVTKVMDKLDSIEIDTGYLVSRVARLEKMAK